MKETYVISLIRQNKNVYDLIDLFDDDGCQKPQLNPIQGPSRRVSSR